jgi:hypothetical protein
MGNPATLIDVLYRASFKNEAVQGWTNNAKWRAALAQSRRFVLDDAMSTFMGELGTQAFARPESAKRRGQMAEHLRMGARLPFPTTWIEYNLRLCQTRSSELLGRPFAASEVPKQEGWLLQQHPDGRYDTWTFPVAMGWTSDDTPLPWRAVPLSEDGLSASECAVGLTGYRTAQAAYVFSDMVKTPPKPQAIADLMKEWSGVMRRMWAFLATIADLPVQVTEVRASKGFIGRGQYRRYLDHRTVTLNVPQKNFQKVARHALALAHRRAHQVRAHFRKNWRAPLSPLCEHQWISDEKHMTCTHCQGQKIWIKDHTRGNAALGFTTHDFAVRHE